MSDGRHPRFWAFTCTLCNGTHEETIRRLDVTMVDALHLVIFNLILSKNQKFHDLESSILPFLKKKMKYLSSNSASFKIQRLDLETVSKVLATNKGRFMCGSEAGNQVGGLVMDIWRRDDDDENWGNDRNYVKAMML